MEFRVIGTKMYFSSICSQQSFCLVIVQIDLCRKIAHFDNDIPQVHPFKDERKGIWNSRNLKAWLYNNGLGERKWQGKALSRFTYYLFKLRDLLITENQMYVTISCSNRALRDSASLFPTIESTDRSPSRNTRRAAAERAGRESTGRGAWQRQHFHQANHCQQNDCHLNATSEKVYLILSTLKFL